MSGEGYKAQLARAIRAAAEQQQYKSVGAAQGAMLGVLVERVGTLLDHIDARLRGIEAVAAASVEAARSTTLANKASIASQRAYVASLERRAQRDAEEGR